MLLKERVSPEERVRQEEVKEEKKGRAGEAR